MEFSGDEAFGVNLDIGYRYFKNTFFKDDEIPKYYNDRIYPIDIQCAAQAIDTLSYFSDNDGKALDLALAVAKWTTKHMQDPKDGHFYYRRYPLFTARTPYFHWGQATMFKALSHLLKKLNERLGIGRDQEPVSDSRYVVGGIDRCESLVYSGDSG